ncbi:MAG: hypothetical protein ACRCZ0_10985 [Cetobacterium sp.]
MNYKEAMRCKLCKMVDADLSYVCREVRSSEFGKVVSSNGICDYFVDGDDFQYFVKE